MDLVHEGDHVRLFLERHDDDGEQPTRRLYWLHSRSVSGWSALFDTARVEGWLEIAVPSEFPGGDKRKWRLATRFAAIRTRIEPEAIGVGPQFLGDVDWERD